MQQLTLPISDRLPTDTEWLSWPKSMRDLWLRREIESARRPSELLHKPALTFDELARLLGLSNNTCQRLADAGDWPPMFKLGPRHFILTRDAIDWIEKIAFEKRVGSMR